MTVEESVRTRITQLIEEGAELSRGYGGAGQVLSEQHAANCMGWIAAAHHVVYLVCPSPSNAYRQRADQIAGAASDSGYVVNERVGELRAVLTRLLEDIDAGLLASVANQARAEIFDDFLDHADSYLKEGRKNEAGAIAGVVFEDTIRRVCRDQGISEAGVKLDTLISELAKQEVVSQSKAKRARSAAHVRTKATHAQWDEFDENDVRAAIMFTRELVSEHLDR